MVQVFELIDWTGLTILPRHALPVASLVGYIRDVTPVTGGNSQIRKGSHYEVAWIRKSRLIRWIEYFGHTGIPVRLGGRQVSG